MTINLDTPTTRLPAIAVDDPPTLPIPVLTHICPPADLLPEPTPPAPMSLADFIAWRRTELSVVDPERLLDAVHLVLDDLVEQYGETPPNGSDSGWFRVGEVRDV